MITWREIKLYTLQKMFSADGNTIPSDDSTKDYIAGMPAVANEALQLLATAGKFIIKSIDIAHNPVTHAGNKLYFEGKSIYNYLADERSRSWQFKDGMYLIDGKQMIQVAPVYFGEEQSDAGSFANVRHYLAPFETESLEELRLYGYTYVSGPSGYTRSLDHQAKYSHPENYMLSITPCDESTPAARYEFDKILYGFRCVEGGNNYGDNGQDYFSDELDIVHKRIISNIRYIFLDTSSGWTKTTVNGKTVYSHAIPADMKNCTDASEMPILECDSAETTTYANIGKDDYYGAPAPCQITVYNGKIYYYPYELDNFFTYEGYYMDLYYALSEPEVIELASSPTYSTLLDQINEIKYPESGSFTLQSDPGNLWIKYKSENVVDRYRARPVEEVAYIPTLTISKDPSGGGTQYEDLNLLQPGFTETFLGQADVKDYCMSFGGLDAKLAEHTANVLGDTALDVALDTVPSLASDISNGESAGTVAKNAAKNVGANLGWNVLGEARTNV